ncbi:MAG TPA: hypothetical protein VGM44_21385 [Polyangiaceae bacterium]
MSAVAGMAACSSSDDTSAAGSAGDTSAGGTTSTGGTTAGGTTAAGGAADCTFASDDCGTCIGTNCQAEEQACTTDQMMCEAPFFGLADCVCGGTMSLSDCETAFKTAGGDKATALADCFDANCTTACQ